MLKAVSIAVSILLAGLAYCFAPPGPLGASAQSSVSATYGVANPSATWTMTTSSVVVGSTTYQIFAPSNYAALGFSSPIIAWGNGTNAAPTSSYYSDLMSQLVSWGFTVIAPDLNNTGSGTEIVQGAQYLVAQDTTQGSQFYGHLNTSEVASVGHSQGATGAMRAAEQAPSLFKTAMTFSLPWNGQGPANTGWSNNWWWPHGWAGTNSDCATWQDCWVSPGDVTHPTFLISTRGSNDATIAPPRVEQCYFQELQAPSAHGLIKYSPANSTTSADHNSIQDSGSPTGFYGYATAWLMYQLRGDSFAAEAFTGSQPQLNSDPNWAGSAVTGASTNPTPETCDYTVPGAS